MGNYGRLYNKAAMLGGYPTVSEGDTIQGICPDGWHIPSNAEWETLIEYIGGTEFAGGKLKATGTDYWKAPNEGATNEFGFNARGAGCRIYDNSYVQLNVIARFGSSTLYNEYHIYYNELKIREGELKDIEGISVRCISN